MTTVKPNLIARDDTLLGVCEALGEDLGLRSNLLRVAFAMALFWNPAATVGAYAGLGLLVAVTRRLVPNPRPREEAERSEPWSEYAEAA